jgi:hypothetical protein
VAYRGLDVGCTPPGRGWKSLGCAPSVAGSPDARKCVPDPVSGAGLATPDGGVSEIHCRVWACRRWGVSVVSLAVPIGGVSRRLVSAAGLPVLGGGVSGAGLPAQSASVSGIRCWLPACRRRVHISCAPGVECRAVGPGWSFRADPVLRAGRRLGGARRADRDTCACAGVGVCRGRTHPAKVVGRCDRRHTAPRAASSPGSRPVHPFAPIHRRLRRRSISATPRVDWASSATARENVSRETVRRNAIVILVL